MLTSLIFAFLQSRAEPVYMWDLTGLKVGAEQTLETRMAAWDMLHAATALQGLANRKEAKFYLNFVGNQGQIDGYWFGKLKKGWLKSKAVKNFKTLDEALAKFKTIIKGVVVWDDRVPATSNVASTIAGVESLIPVRFDQSAGSLYRHLVLDRNGPSLKIIKRLIKENGEQLFTGHGMIPDINQVSSGSAKCDAYLWAAHEYLKKGKCSGGWMGYYPDAYWLKYPNGVPLERTLLTNHDFFISKKAFFFDLSPWADEAPDDDLNQKRYTDEETLELVLKREYELNHGKFSHVGGFTPWDQKYTDFTGRKHGGVETEWRYAEILTSYNAYMDADAPGLHAMANASFYTHQPRKAEYKQANLPTLATLAQRGFLNPNGTVKPKPYISIYVGDYDSAAWLYTMMPQVWDDAARGSIPLGWAFNPALEARFPTGLIYARESATKNDFFISGDSGYGYVNPGYLNDHRRWGGLPSGLDSWRNLNQAGFKRWDLGIVGFAIDGNAPAMDTATKEAYTRFAPAGVVAQKVPELSIVKDTPFLRMQSDLPHHNSDAAAHIVTRDSPKAEASFHIYRTILWSASDHSKLFSLIRSLRPDIEIVDPYTLMMLAKKSVGN